MVHTAPKIPPHAASFLDRHVLKAYYRDEAEKVFKPIRAFFRQHGIQADCAARTGHVAEMIAKLATDGAFDLLMMGSHGHGSVGNLVLGSVATQVPARCTAPVLLVR